MKKAFFTLFVAISLVLGACTKEKRCGVITSITPNMAGQSPINYSPYTYKVTMAYDGGGTRSWNVDRERIGEFNVGQRVCD